MSNNELHYRTTARGDVCVAINPLNYVRSLKMVLELHQNLCTAIPFQCEVSSEPEVHVLGGDNRRNMISVEMSIRPKDGTDDVVAKLERAGFHKGFEPRIE